MASYSLEGYRRANDVREFCRRHIVIPDGPGAGRHLDFEPWYWKNIILPIYGTLDTHGRRRYNKAIIGVARWHIKSTSAAALALYALAREPIPGAEANAVATTISQAGRVFGKARRMIAADPLLRHAFTVTRSLIECNETGATLQVLPHDVDTAQGFHPQFAALDELHVYRNLDLVNAMVSGSAGYAEPLIFCITTAGEERRGAWWELLRQWRDDPTAYVWWCGAQDGDDLEDPATWRRANPASWITNEMLARQRHSLPLASYCRYHLNLAPTKAANRVFERARWEACGARPHIDPDLPCVIGVDASQRRDHTAVVLDQLDAQGRHNVMCFAFAAEAEGDIMSAIDTDAVGELIRELCGSYHVVRIPCDRAYNVRLMGELLAEGLPIEEFAQTDQNMTRACQRLFDAVAEGRLRHGNDRVLSEYVLNAAVKTGRQGGFRFTKPDEESKIDGAIALAMAVDVAEAEWGGGGGFGVIVG